MRVGLLGGTFDPPHVGHVLAASDAFEALALDRLYWVPAAQQPLKAGGGSGGVAGGGGGGPSSISRPPGAQRLEMVQRAVAGDSRFEVSAIEIERGGLSFTVDTLQELADRSPDDTRYLLLGADVLATFAKWRQPERILELATLAIFPRVLGDGDARDAKGLWEDFSTQWRELHGKAVNHHPVFLATRRIDVSSTEVRERLAAGLSIHGFVPDAVASYIAERGLYR